jgi:uncharacterized protein
MKLTILRGALAAAAFCAASAMAAPATPESVERLLAAAHLEQLMQQMRVQQQAMISGMLERTMKDRAPEERAKAQDGAQRALAIVNDELSWDKLRPLMVQVYTETFTQEEVEGLTAFYESAVGRAYVDKQPIAMQRAGQLIGARMQVIMQKMQASLLPKPSTATTAPR